MAISNRWPNDPLRWADEMFRAFSPLMHSQATRAAGVFPPVNIYDDGTSYLVRTEVPGMNKEDFEITVKGDQLVLRGQRNVEAAQDNANYHRRECEGGAFRRAVTLPQPVDGDRITATYANGVLEIVLPRVPEAQPRKIQIN